MEPISILVGFVVWAVIKSNSNHIHKKFKENGNIPLDVYQEKKK
jgi:hypothetical protein